MRCEIAEMDEPICNAVVLRVGELFLKRGNRGRFVGLLLDNLCRLTEDLPWRSEYYQGRVLLSPSGGSHPADSIDELLERAGCCFGISSLSPVVMVQEPEPGKIARLGSALASAEVPPGARSFRVAARRSDKRFPFTSQDLGRIVGAAVGEAIDLPVNLSRPDFVLGVEVGPRSFIYARTIPGPGGLPVGSSAKLLLLLSGGIDSPVAGYLSLKRGCPLEAIHFHSPPYTGPAALEKVNDLCRRLAVWGGPLTLHSLPMTELQLAVKENAPRGLSVLLYRRFMVRLACRVAVRQRAVALVSGDSIGQVASQTVENLACIDAVADRPMLRPLLCFDKEETVQLARRIGTYEISIRPYEDSCSLFVPRHPELRARLHYVERAEERLPMEDLLRGSMERLETAVIEE